MRLMSKFYANDFNYKIVYGSYKFVTPSTFENVPTRLAAKLGRLVFRSLLNTEPMYSNAAVHGEVRELEFGSVHVL